MAGREAKVEPLKLITGEDFEWFYRWNDGNSGDWPTGRTLYYLFQDGTSDDGWSDGTRWDFVITGAIAKARKESTDADILADRTPYRLVMADSTTSPTTEHILVIGNVKRQEPKR